MFIRREITAHFRGLSSQWITAVKALCYSTGATSNGYVELLDEIDVSYFIFSSFIRYIDMNLYILTIL
jgi:hypothetical protein